MYQDVILPLTVLRRLDCVLEPTKDRVLEVYSRYGDELEDPHELEMKGRTGITAFRTGCRKARGMAVVHARSNVSSALSDIVLREVRSGGSGGS